MANGMNTGARARGQRPGLGAAIFGLLLSLAVLFFFRLIRGDLAFRDPFFEVYPLRLMWGYALNGSFALWDPYIGAGHTLPGAVFPASFYPLNGILLYLLRLPANLEVRVYTITHYWLAGVGMWYLLRALDARRAAAMTAAVAYAFSGFLVSMHYAQNLLPGMALSPLSIGLLLRARAVDRPLYSALAGAAAALIYLGGDPQGFAVNLGLSMAAAGFIRPPGSARTGPARAGLLTFLFLAMAIAGAGAELFPSLAVFQASPRSQGFDLDSAAFWSFHPARLVEFFVSRPWGDIWPIYHYWPEVLPMALSPYLGIWTLLTAGFALRPGVLRHDRRAQFFAAVALFFLLLAFGKYFPIFGFLLEVVPGFGAFRFPEKYLQPVTLAIAVLSGLGVELALAGTPATPAGRKPWLVPAAAALSAGAIVMVGLLLREPLGGQLRELAPDGNWDLVSGPAAVGTAAWAVGRSILLFAFGWWLLGRLRRSSARWPVMAGIAFLFVDLLWANSPLAPTEPGIFQQRSRMADIILAREGLIDPSRPPAAGIPCCSHTPFKLASPPGRFRVFRHERIRLPNEICTAEADGTFHLDQRDYLRWMRDNQKPNLSILDGLENFGGQSAATPQAFLRIRDEILRLDQLAAFNVKYLIIPPDREPEVTDAATVLDRSPGAVLLELRDPLPRAYWIGSERVVKDDQELEQALSRQDLRRQVIISREPGLPRPPPLPGDGGMVPAAIKSYEPNRVEVEVTAPAPGWLVLSDGYFPGWSATVDGQPAQVYRVNGMVRGVRLLAGGKHRVVFSYWPVGLTAGLASTAAAIAVLMLVAAATAFSSRRSASPGSGPA